MVSLQKVYPFEALVSLLLKLDRVRNALVSLMECSVDILQCLWRQLVLVALLLRDIGAQESVDLLDDIGDGDEGRAWLGPDVDAPWEGCR